MKILLESTAIFALPPTGYAGTERIVYDLARGLDELGHEVAVVAPVGSKLPDGIEHIPTVPPSYDATREDDAWPTVLARLVNLETHEPTGEFDIVHCHGFRMWPYMAAKDHPEVKVCATVHWLMHWPSIGSGPPPVPKTNLIGLSNAHALATSAALGVPVRHAYNGIDPDLYPLKEEKGDRYLFLGRIARFKGAHIAVDLADRHGLPTDIIGEDRFVGDPPYVTRVMSSCKRMARYWGEVSFAKKVRMLQDAKAVLFPAIWPEPFGLVPVEAGACGTPVVALDYPGSAVSEIVEDGVNGFLCRTVEEMGEACSNVSDIKPEECRRVVEERFTAAIMSRRYEALYREVLGGGW